MTQDGILGILIHLSFAAPHHLPKLHYGVEHLAKGFASKTSLAQTFKDFQTSNKTSLQQDFHKKHQSCKREHVNLDHINPNPNHCKHA